MRLVYMKQSVWPADALVGGGVASCLFDSCCKLLCNPFFSKQLLAKAYLEVPGIEPETKFPE